MDNNVTRLIAMTAALVALIPFASADETSILGMRMWSAPDSTRVVFDVSAPAEYKVFRLGNPDRIVIDFKNARLKKDIGRQPAKDAIIGGIRYAPRGDGGLRVVLDVSQKIQVKSFLLDPNEQYGNRLVVDLLNPQPTPVASTSSEPEPVKRAPDGSEGIRPVVVAIDAGHGGEDPGARGYSGLYEKDAVLAIARKLHTLIEAEPGMRPVMIRDGDYFVSLRKRTIKAREAKADLFVSIHADAFRDKRVRGSSLFILSKHGASNEAARWLAERENASDLIGGVSLEDKDDVLASVLLDLSQSATIEASYEVGQSILQRMSPIGKLHKPSVQQAGFVVLKSPDIPSVLVETAYISNPEDEKKLRDPRIQQDIAQAIFAGVRDYFAKHPPAGSVFAGVAPKQHIVSQGDTLSALAQQYRVSLDKLRTANQLKGDMVRVGQVLVIPAEEG
jgi:N-acetylmuramoyl-L-alanine amidase